MEAILGPRLNSKVGPISSSGLNAERYVLLFASASWCPPCQQFLPILKEFYRVTNPQQLQIVWLSRDRTLDEYNSYYQQMPWLAVPFEKDLLERLLKFY